MIRKFFGTGDLFIYAVSDTKLRGKVYKTGEIISYFDGVQLSLGYNLTHKEGTSTKREVSYTEQDPYNLNVSQVPNTKEVDKIFFASPVKTEIEYTTVRKYENITDVIYLKDRTSPFKVRVFSEEGEIDIDEESYDEEELEVKVPGSYRKLDVLSYYKNDNAEKRKFKKPELGYVRIAATIRGKLGDKDGAFVLDVPLADLVSEPVMDLTEESNYHVNLSFALVNSGVNEPTVVFIDE